MSDYVHIRKELLCNGVNKKLLWTEYLEECRLSGDEPLMYSQFCYYIHQDEQKRRATMHINRKHDAYIGDINYTSGRKLNRSLIERLATCEYITEHRN